jgi:hypothetical protein
VSSSNWPQLAGSSWFSVADSILEFYGVCLLQNGGKAILNFGEIIAAFLVVEMFDEFWRMKQNYKGLSLYFLR